MPTPYNELSSLEKFAANQSTTGPSVEYLAMQSYLAGDVSPNGLCVESATMDTGGTVTALICSVYTPTNLTSASNVEVRDIIFQPVTDSTGAASGSALNVIIDSSSASIVKRDSTNYLRITFTVISSGGGGNATFVNPHADATLYGTLTYTEGGTEHTVSHLVKRRNAMTIVE